MDKEIEKQGIIDYWTWRKEKDIVAQAKLTPEGFERQLKEAGLPSTQEVLETYAGGGVVKKGANAVKQAVTKKIDPSEPYVIIDTHTNKIVGRYKYKDAGRARARRDKLDLEYGAVRYQTRLEKDLNSRAGPGKAAKQENKLDEQAK